MAVTTLNKPAKIAWRAAPKSVLAQAPRGETRRERWERLGLGDAGAEAARRAVFLDDETAFAARLDTLTTIQIVVLSLMAQGWVNKQIAFACEVTEATVKAHASNLLRRLNIRSRTEAAVRFAVFLERCRAHPDDSIGATSPNQAIVAYEN